MRIPRPTQCEDTKPAPTSTTSRSQVSAGRRWGYCREAMAVGLLQGGDGATGEGPQGGDGKAVQRKGRPHKSSVR